MRLSRLRTEFGPAAIVFVLLVLAAAPARSQSVSGFTLVNADTDADIGPLLDGDVLDLTTLPTRNLNVRADTQPDLVGSVRFAYDGDANYQTENVAPYALAGDNSGDYNPWTPAPGPHTLTATPYTESGAAGTAGAALTVGFTVVDGGGGGDPPSCPPDDGMVDVAGELRQWHAVTLTFDGPCAGESAPVNPFRDYRLAVTFTHDATGTSVEAPGYFAADGNAAETGADTGTQWRVHFAPGATGTWAYTASFRTGADVALSTDPAAGTPTDFDGAAGTFSVGPTDKTGRDHRGKGVLRHDEGTRYLRFDNGEVFLKGGADSPENFLAYADFDGTYNHVGTDYVKTYTPHLGDWQTGDPTWQGGKGKGIIGALNYLASEGMNSVYFLTMNVNGDGKDVWPWTSHTERYRYDVSKLAQWELVFSHMDRLGIMLHVLTQETENDQLLDGGALGPERRLYYRELIARFGHHLALTWNLGEENTNTDAQRKAFADYVRALDPYDHPTVVHTYPGSKDAVFTPLLGHPTFDGPSLQMGNMSGTHAETKKWIDESTAAGRPWFVSLDEIGPAGTGVTPDGSGNNHDQVRQQALWGSLMAGGAGVEWYFGYNYPHSDLTCEDWRSRDRMWDYTRFALDFFRNHLPFTEMAGDDDLTSATDDYVLARPGQAYAVYLPGGGSPDLNLAFGTYDVRWYDPRTGGALQTGGTASVTGPGVVSLGSPPSDPALDWAVLVTLADDPGGADYVRVASIETGSQGAGKGRKLGTASVAVVDDLGRPVAGAVVTGDFGGDIVETGLTATTDGNGVAAFESTGTTREKNPAVTFCVSDVQAGIPYDPTQNPTGTSCSNGADPTTLHVVLVETGSTGLGKGLKAGTAVVWIEDDLGNAVPNATVTGDFGGDITEPGVSGTTAAGGSVQLQTTATSSGKVNVTFCVQEVTHPDLTYVPGDYACSSAPASARRAGAAGVQELTPTSYALGANYPNPFNPSASSGGASRTAIPYSLPEPAHVRLDVFDATGRRVAVLVDRQMGAGVHTAVFEAGGLPSGVYLYRLQAGSYVASRTMLYHR